MTASDEEILKQVRDLQSSLQERFGEKLVPEVERMIVQLCKGTGKSVTEVFEEFTKTNRYRKEIDRTHN